MPMVKCCNLIAGVVVIIWRPKGEEMRLSLRSLCFGCAQQHLPFSLCFFLSDIQGGCCFRVFIFVLGFASRLKIRTFAIPNGGNGLTESGQRQQGDKKSDFFLRN